MASRGIPSTSEPVGLGEEQSSRHQLDPAFVDRLKVAAATAIIKQKPADMSGKTYAEQLARRLRERSESWQEKAKSLERELIRTKQELLLTKAAFGHRNDENETAVTSNSTVNSSASSDAPFLTPPSSSENCAEQDHKVALAKNTTFLYSLAIISSQNSDTESCSKFQQKAADVVMESVQAMVDFIMNRLRKRPLCKIISLRMMQEAADSIVRILEISGADAASWKQNVITSASKLVEGILEEILNSSQLCNTFSQRESCCIILRLAKSPLLLSPIILPLLERIERTSVSLRNIRSHGNSLNVQLLENSYFLFTTMEDILVSVTTASSSSSSMCPTSSKAERGIRSSLSMDHVPPGKGHRHNIHQEQRLSSEHSGSRKISSSGENARGNVGNRSKCCLDKGFRTNIQARLEESLLHISSDFPLYAQYVWRLTGILELMNEG